MPLKLRVFQRELRVDARLVEQEVHAESPREADQDRQNQVDQFFAELQELRRSASLLI